MNDEDVTLTMTGSGGATTIQMVCIQMHLSLRPLGGKQTLFVPLSKNSTFNNFTAIIGSVWFLWAQQKLALHQGLQQLCYFSWNIVCNLTETVVFIVDHQANKLCTILLKHAWICWLNLTREVSINCRIGTTTQRSTTVRTLSLNPI